MSEENKALVRRTFELFNQGDLDGAAECWSNDFLMHVPYHPHEDEFSGRENLKRLFQRLRSAFENIHYTIEDMIAEDDKVAFRVTWRGIFVAEFFGLQPTGKEVISTGVAIYRIANGKIVEDWGVERFADRPWVKMVRQIRR
jgi:steroid delta-isomerase-like uncharacterized protein